MYKHRQILLKIHKILNSQVNILLLGSRQVGKTVILKILRQELIDKHMAEERQIFYFDLERGEDLNNLSSKTPDEFLRQLYIQSALPPKTPLFIFIDEIQYLSNASSFLKVIADHHEQIRLFMSGSSSLEIKRLFTDRLTGRKISLRVNTLNFKEYLDFQEHPLNRAWQKIDTMKILSGDIGGLSDHIGLLPQIHSAYEEFVVYGGYPKPSLAANASIRRELVEEIRDQYARRDVRDILNIENITGFNRLIGLLAAHVGNLANINELTLSANLNRQTLEKYLFLLQETFILKLVRPYFANRRKELTKMAKVFFYDTGLRNALIGQFDAQRFEFRPDKGALVENSIWQELNTFGLEIRYWRTATKSEVDFIVSAPNSELIPLEVKYQSMTHPTTPSGLSAFIKKYNPPRAFVATKDFLGQTRVANTDVFFVPTVFF